MNAAHQNYIVALERLTPETLEELGYLLADDVRFRDPFNDVSGRRAMLAVFDHMFRTVGPVTFSVVDAAATDNTLLMSWRFSAHLRNKPWSIVGTTIIRFSDDGLVLEHTDQWDAAQGFYERLPIIGWLLRHIRRGLLAC